MKKPRLVLVGLGHAHIEVIRRLATKDSIDADVTLISPSTSIVYSGLIPAFLAQQCNLGEASIDARKWIEKSKITFVQGQVSRWNAGEKTFVLEDGSSVEYDLACLNVGSQTKLPESSLGTAVPGRPLQQSAQAIEQLLRRCKESSSQKNIHVVGAGLAGIEVALTLGNLALRNQLPLRVHLHERQRAIAPNLNSSQQQTLAKHLEQARVLVQTDVDAPKIGSSNDLVLYFTGPSGHTWIDASGADCQHGFLMTNASLQSISHPEVFGAGDCIRPKKGHYDKSGILPVRQGPLLLSIFRAQLAGRPLPQFVAKKNLMYILNHGNQQATLLWRGRSWSGRLPSVLKTWIDNRFVSRYR